MNNRYYKCESIATGNFHVSDGYNEEYEELLMMTDDELYYFFYPNMFKPQNSYVPADYAYVHKELSKVGVTEVLL